MKIRKIWTENAQVHSDQKINVSESILQPWNEVTFLCPGNVGFCPQTPPRRVRPVTILSSWQHLTLFSLHFNTVESRLSEVVGTGALADNPELSYLAKKSD